jgi:hypothetical protein
VVSDDKQCRADLGERLCAKSTKRFFDKLVNPLEKFTKKETHII